MLCTLSELKQRSRQAVLSENAKGGSVKTVVPAWWEFRDAVK